MKDTISVIVPIYNELVRLDIWHQRLLKLAFEPDKLEVIFVEAGDVKEDNFKSSDPKCRYVTTEKPHRAAQMNLGAAVSQGDILYFLHVDSLPPKNFDKQIRLALESTSIGAGCFQLQFDWTHPMLKFYAFFSRFKQTIFHGGDASLFVHRSLFEAVQGYNEQLNLMEDYDLIDRLKSKRGFTVLKDAVMTSARKYKTTGVFKLQWHYFVIQMMHRMNYSQYELLNYYRKRVL